MNKRGLIGTIVILGILIVAGFFWFVGEWDKEEVECVPASCCHATECVLKSEAPNCDGIFCTMVCSGPLDCGAGRCEYIEGECKVVKNE